jgi:hypothetical protein
MSDETVTPEAQAVVETADTIPPTPSGSGIQTVPAKKKSPRFLSANDLESVVRILAAADKITPEEAVRRLNLMCEKGTLVIVPPLGVRK